MIKEKISAGAVFEWVFDILLYNPPEGDGIFWGGFVLCTTSVSPLDRDKDTLSLTREKCWRIFPFFLFFFVWAVDFFGEML